MRNPSRIYPLLNQIGDIWSRHPDLRFGQLIKNIEACGPGDGGLFCIEDDEFEKAIEKFEALAKNKKIIGKI